MNAAFWLFTVIIGAVWFAMIGRAGPSEWIFGLAVVTSAWWLFDRLSEFGNQIPLRHTGAFVRGVGGYLALHVSRDILRSTLRVFKRVLQPRIDIRPAILAVPLPEASPAALMLLAYGISLTPGQQVVAIDEERRILYVHTFDVPDPEAVRQGIRDLYHRYIKEGTQW